MTTIDIIHEKLGSEVGDGHGKKMFMAVASERDDNHTETAFAPTDQTLQKTVKVKITPNAIKTIDVADDMFLKLNYENTHASSVTKIFSFWKLFPYLIIKENNMKSIELAITDTIDDIWRCELIGKPYDEQRFINYYTNNCDDFNE